MLTLFRLLSALCRLLPEGPARAGCAEWRNRLALRLLGPGARFRLIYDENLWGDGESRSGTGSNLANTAAIRAALPPLLERLAVRSVLDVPCGDFHWFKEMDLTLEHYYGADVVAPLIDSNRRHYGGPRHHFAVLDLTRDPLPSVDLILCRDLLVHLAEGQVWDALANIKRSGARYLLTTTFTDEGRDNGDIPTGIWRPLNLTRPPYRFPPPLEVIDEGYLGEGGIYADKSLGLWEVASLPERPPSVP
ncbi:class I SAM-dependent methyltransferase [Endothiovibrio diazotrophicus]